MSEHPVWAPGAPGQDGSGPTGPLTLTRARLGTPLVVVVVAAVYAWSARGTQLSIHTFMSGLPLLRGTVARMWPPAFDQLSVYADDAVQSVQIALMGTTLAALLALPVALLAARNLTRRRYITWPLRAVLNAARGISPLVFALLFVSVVGLSAQKGWGKGARRWVNEGVLSRCPERRPTDPALACARNVFNPALLRA